MHTFKQWFSFVKNTRSAGCSQCFSRFCIENNCNPADFWGVNFIETEIKIMFMTNSEDEMLMSQEVWYFRRYGEVLNATNEKH